MRRLALLLCLLPGLAGAYERESIDLSGTWQTVRSDKLDAPPADGWQPIQIPSTVPGYKYVASWFQREVDVPASWQGRRIDLVFGGVRWNSQVFVNDQLVGGHYNGFDAFRLDATAAIRPGQRNRIRVGAHDFTGVFDPTAKPVEWDPKQEVREQPRDRVLAPIGGVVGNYGIWDRCRLEAAAPLHAEDVAITTSVTDKRLGVEVTLHGTAGVSTATVAATVLERGSGRTVLALPPIEVRPELGRAVEAELGAPWPNPHLWTPEDPYLYDLKVTVTPAGRAADADEQTLRFGFREIRVQGPDFYLNGVKLRLHSSSWWPSNPPETDDQVRAKLQALIDANTRCFRTHTQPWPENWYTIADELGVMMIPEGAVWNDRSVYRLDDARFWTNYREHLLAMVRHLRNHPSIIMYSLENEFYGPGMNEQTPEREAKLGALADAVRAEDPTRPVTYESDLDPAGKADVLGLHYPNEWPSKYQWPNAGDWLDKPLIKRDGPGGFWHEGAFLWNRKKPLYIGEFLWIPSNNPDAVTVFYGDQAYQDYGRYHKLAKAVSWDMQIKAYRRAAVSGFSPWTMVEGGPLDETNPLWRAHREAYRQLAAFPREMDSRFFTGDKVVRTLDVYNDTLAPVTLTLSVGFEGEQPLTVELPELPPAGQRVEQVTLTAPKPGANRLTVSLTSGGKACFADFHPVTIVPRPAPLASEAGLYDPKGAAGDLGLAKVAALEGNLPRVLVVAPGALGTDEPAKGGPAVVGGDPGVGQRLAEYVRGGGRLLVLDQPALPEGLFGLTLVARDSTMAFPVATSSPVLAGIGPDDLKFWRGDHFVTHGELRRPLNGGALPLAVTGSAAGVDGSPLLEVRAGDGVALLSTLLLAEKRATEPAAARILSNALSYLQAWRPAPHRTAAWCPDPALRTRLEEVRLDAAWLTGDAPKLDGYDVAVVVDPPKLAPPAPALRAFVERGGRLVLSHVRPEAGDLAAVGLDGVRLRASGSSVTRAEGIAGPLADALLREDLYWLGKQTAVYSWNALPRLQEQAVAVASPQVDGQAGTVYPCAAMKVEGAYAGIKDDYAYLASSGTVRGTIRVPAEGDYLLGVTGWGSPCEGVYPLVSISVAGEKRGEVYLGSAKPVTDSVRAHLKAGEQPLELAFVNDASNGNEDRNTYLHHVNLVPDTSPTRAQWLTTPAAVLHQPVGRGEVILDEVRWESAPGNEGKARRYLASLLTGAGAAFRPGGGGTVLDAESFRIQPGLQYVSVRNGEVQMVQACWIERDLEVRRAGDYTLVVSARGDPARNEWPHATLTLDGKPVGEFTAASPGTREYRLPVALPAGQHTLRVTYDNDLWAPETHEDRNLHLQRIVLEPREAGR